MKHYWDSNLEEDANFSDLQGKIISKVRISREEDLVVFYTTDGEEYRMFHSQNCCETVEIEDVVGDWHDVMGEPIVLAEERVNEQESREHDESHTWTFYEIQTRKGSVNIRWHGSSNGYYSESVDFYKVKK